jgi:hypothetical protein
MRAVPILATLALADGLLVAAGSLDAGHRDTIAALRPQLLSIIVVAGAGCVALAALRLAAHFGRRHRLRLVRIGSALAIGAVYALAPLAFAGWTYFWLTPTHWPVALICGACALLLLWQGLGGDGEAPKREHDP